MQSTTLAILLEEMNREKDIDNLEEQYKVKAIDGAIRRLRRESVFPWTIKKGSLKVFNGVKEYPVASDHDELIYLDPTNLESYSQAARFFNTSLQQFYEDVMSNRNLMAEIWQDGTPQLGVNYKDLGLESIQLDSAEDSGNYDVTDLRDTGALSPGTMADDDTVGTVAWSNPDNAKVSNNVYATADLSTIPVIDSYDESNDSGNFLGMFNGSVYESAGQSFANVNLVKLDSCKFYLYKNGSPTGNAVAKLYSHTGTYGTTGTPLTLLATSDNFDVSNLTTSLQLITFNFSGAEKITLSASTYYCIVLDASGVTGDSSNSVKIEMDNTGLHPGKLVYSADAITWTATALSFDVIFYVYGNYISHYLKATNFGFAIPTGARIKGILAEIEQKSTATTTENAIKIVKSDGTIGTTNKSTGATLPSSDNYVSYGSSTDLWGETWTPADINDIDFGVVFSTFGTGISSVDHIRITVYYNLSDAVSVSEDLVNYKEGNGSIRIVITSSTTIANIVCTFPVALSDSLYKSKYHFRWIYLDAVPTSIEMRLRTSASNYLKTVITAQFSGAAFKADSWNLIAQNLDEATEMGTFNSGSIASEKIILNGAATGVYYLDTANLREWKLFDYWYYSKYVVMADGSSAPDQEKFYRNSNWNTADSLIGDQEWIDVILYEAMEGLLVGINNVNLFSYVMRKKKEAWDAFSAKYPDMVPVVTTMRYRFDDEPIIKNLYDR